MDSVTAKDKEGLYATVFAELKSLGVKVPKLKKFKSDILKQDSSNSSSSGKRGSVFGVKLIEQEWISGEEYPIPKFIAMVTEYLQKFTTKEIGLFRKAGNFARQRRLRAKIENGESLAETDPNDVASILKQWLRELPVPLIPFYLHDLFLRSQTLDSKNQCNSACLLIFLLLPSEHQHTLKHLLRFLSDIALKSDKNKMGTYNLALIMAPNIFVAQGTVDKPGRSNLVYQHTAIIEILIKNSDKIGEIPSSVSLQPSLREANSNVSIDVLNCNSSKCVKKAKSGSVQDIFSGFKKFVGQNGASTSRKESEEDMLRTQLHLRCASKRKADPELQPLSITKKKKQALSLADLKSPLLLTSRNKDKVLEAEENRSNHSRRKSFGALFLRRKEKKRSDSTAETSEFCIKAIENGRKLDVLEMGNTSEAIDSKFQANDPKLDSSTKRKDAKYSKSHSENSKQKGFSKKPVLSTFSDNTTSGKSSKRCIWHVPPESSTPYLGSKGKISSTTDKYNEARATPKPQFIKKEAFIMNSINTEAQNTVSQVKLPRDLSKNLKSNVVNKESFKKLDNTCSQDNKSICNVKCDKNKFPPTELIADHNQRQETHSEEKHRNVSLKSKRQLHNLPNPEREVRNFLKASVSPVVTISPVHSKSSTCENYTVENPEPQSLDLSLNLLLQNFCLSPPNNSQEITLSIGISSVKAEQELKVNVCQKDTGGEQNTVEKQSQVNERKRAGRSRMKPRLSSNSDSRIPRLKKIPGPSRPNSFSGGLVGGKHKLEQVLESEDTPTRETCIEKETVPASTVQEESISDSCFKTPDNSFNSTTWMCGSQYLSALSSPDEEMINKRESIIKILKEAPGHVHAKINLFESTGNSNSLSAAKSGPSGERKLLRTTSEKQLTSTYGVNRAKLSSTDSYDSANRSRSVRYKSNFPKSAAPHFKLTTPQKCQPSKKLVPTNKTDSSTF